MNTGRIISDFKEFIVNDDSNTLLRQKENSEKKMKKK